MLAYRVLLAFSLFFAACVPSSAAEAWYIFRNGADAWAFEKSGLVKDEATGHMRVQVARYHGSAQSESGVTWTYEIRRYQVDCVAGRTKRGRTERYTGEGRPLDAIPADPNAVWVPASFGWPLYAKNYACYASPERGGVQAPSKISAIATMKTVAESGANVRSEVPSVPVATASPDDFCKSIRTILGDGQMQTPFFNGFYLSAEEKKKYAGQGAKSIPGFGTCKIQQTLTQANKGYATFASYYCDKTDGADSDRAAFAAKISKQVKGCLPNAYYVETNEGGHSIKTYEHTLSIDGFPRVRVRHHKSGVTIHLDAK